MIVEEPTTKDKWIAYGILIFWIACVLALIGLAIYGYLIGNGTLVMEQITK